MKRVFELSYLTVCLAALGGGSYFLPSCKEPPSPLGKHRGSCKIDYKLLSEPVAQPSASETCPDHFDVWNDGDGYKIDLGDCTIHVKPSGQPGEWKLASRAPCLTSKGLAQMDDGKLYLIGESFNLSFTGITNDKRSGVTWGFTTDPKLK